MKRKIVQTVLDEEEYRKLEEAIKKTKKSIKEAVREAVVVWSEEKSGINSDDPIFKLKPASWGDRKASERVDEILYGGRV